MKKFDIKWTGCAHGTSCNVLGGIANKSRLFSFLMLKTGCSLCKRTYSKSLLQTELIKAMKTHKNVHNQFKSLMADIELHQKKKQNFRSFYYLLCKQRTTPRGFSANLFNKENRNKLNGTFTSNEEQHTKQFWSPTTD